MGKKRKSRRFEVWECIDRSIIVSAANEREARKKANRFDPTEWTETVLAEGVLDALPDSSGDKEDN